jgi:hypothetical protein
MRTPLSGFSPASAATGSPDMPSQAACVDRSPTEPAFWQGGSTPSAHSSGNLKSVLSFVEVGAVDLVAGHPRHGHRTGTWLHGAGDHR